MSGQPSATEHLKIASTMKGRRKKVNLDEIQFIKGAKNIRKTIELSEIKGCCTYKIRTG